MENKNQILQIISNKIIVDAILSNGNYERYPLYFFNLITVNSVSLKKYLMFPN